MPSGGKNYDQHRGSAHERGYDRRWGKARSLHLAANPLCIGCLAVGRFEPATVVDHIEPHEGDQARFWDAGNWQSSCAWHHDLVKQKLELMWREGEVPVTALRLGSPEAKRLTRTTPRKATVIGEDGWTS